MNNGETMNKRRDDVAVMELSKAQKPEDMVQPVAPYSHDECQSIIAILTNERNKYRDLAEQWMYEADRLKKKYEPTYSEILETEDDDVRSCANPDCFETVRLGGYCSTPCKLACEDVND